MKEPLSHFVLTAHRVQDGWTWMIHMGRERIEGESRELIHVVRDATDKLLEDYEPAGFEGRKTRAKWQ